MPRAKSSPAKKKPARARARTKVRATAKVRANAAEVKLLIPFEQVPVRKFAVAAVKKGASPKSAIQKGRNLMAKDKLDASGKRKK